MLKENLLENLNESGKELFKKLNNTMEWSLNGLRTIKIDKDTDEEHMCQAVYDYYNYTQVGLRMTKKYLHSIWIMCDYVPRIEYNDIKEVPVDVDEDWTTEFIKRCDNYIHTEYYKVDLRLIDYIGESIKELYRLENHVRKTLFPNIPKGIKKKNDLYNRFGEMEEDKLKRIANLDFRHTYLNDRLTIFYLIDSVPRI
ncbi:hypothetical protein [Clostridium botulinum]|uniref:hypothetical protein n=1 Tax=Clostridium botulinum TaxID=1491 RepID=UPI001E40E9D2|nr:hypothetical protein [Clostridium botulinum]MCD3223827.1 hypothetical protein [Clostridium botulinum C/D]MCD3295273.1 hypothetical protein [Clostridium botulinum C/D]